MSRSSRSTETRVSVARPVAKTQFESELYVDPRTIPPNMVYAWVRESMMNEHDPRNVQRRMRLGWKPVPASRHPDLLPPPLPGYEGEAPTIIRNGGLILMECPKAEWRERAEQRASENFEHMRTVARATGDLNDDPRMPNVTFADQTGIERVTSEFRD